MTKSKGWLIAAAIFVTGAAVGALGTEAWRLTRGGPFGKIARLGPAGFILERMSRDLDLSPQQREEIRPIIEEMVVKMDITRQPCMKEGEAVFEKYMGVIRGKLTPKQAARHDVLLKRLREFGKMGPPPFGLPPGPPPFEPMDGPPPPLDGPPPAPSK